MTGKAGDGVERELKIPVADLDAVRARLLASGAVLEHAESHERNRVYDRPAGEPSLLAAGRLLRLREDGAGVRLTYKGPARFEDGVKVREEREIAVDDAEAASSLLGGLGFEVARRYEKRREGWRLDPGPVRVALDRTPIGEFVEIEVSGRVEAAAVARRLGLDPAAAEPRSYLALWEDWRSRHPGSSRDMVFVERLAEGPPARRRRGDGED